MRRFNVIFVVNKNRVADDSRLCDVHVTSLKYGKIFIVGVWRPGLHWTWANKIPDSKVHGANTGPINFSIWDTTPTLERPMS